MNNFEIKVFDNFDNDVEKFLCKEYFANVGIVGLSGGSTPQNIYKNLGKNCSKIKHISFIQVDERYVEKENDRSNQKMILDTLFASKSIDKFYPVPTKSSDTTLRSSIMEYREILRPLLSQPILLLLGMGEDGHTASLFPNDKLTKQSINNPDEFVLGGFVKIQDEERISLNHQIIGQSQSIVLIKGRKKGRVLKEALQSQSKIDYPILFAINDKTKILMDQECYQEFVKD